MNDRNYSHHLVKRNPELADPNIFKRKAGVECKSDSAIGKIPFGYNQSKINDMIWFYETGYAITAKGRLIDKSGIIILDSIDAIFRYCQNKANIKDINYWWPLMKKKFKSDKVLKYYEYKVEIELIEQPFQLPEKLKRIQIGFYHIKDKAIIHELENPKPQKSVIRTYKIPNRIKQEVFFIHSINNLDKPFLDVDHLIPKKAGGHGSFIENLQPVSYSINRYKNDKIPSGFFKVAKTMKLPSDISHIPTKFLNSNETMIKSKEAKENAKKIMGHLNEKLNDEELRNFYLNVMKETRLKIYKNLVKYKKNLKSK
ncbi:MAG: hypothetical protein GF313_01695 [Caldithrix sp.]|nr:hypothetical protein [Caldithrix sp.]